MIKSQVVADKAHGWFRTWFAKVWKVCGGGLYAVGLGIAFLVFTNYLKEPIERWLFPKDDLP